MKTVIRGGRILTQNTLRDVIDGDVLIDGGRITAVGEVGPQEAARVIDARGLWVLPGFMQAHMHLTQTLFRGFARRQRPLFAIICSDHGTAYGDDGYAGHRLAHPCVWNVPYWEGLVNPAEFS